jgi:DhnA family fructose-bisphosphate aldolase class Ia
LLASTITIAIKKDNTIVHLTHNLSSIDAEKITKYSLAVEMKDTWKLNNVSVKCTVIYEGAVVTKNCLNI